MEAVNELKMLRERKKRKCRVIKEMGIGDGKLLINVLPSGSVEDGSQSLILSRMQPVQVTTVTFTLVPGGRGLG